MAKRSLVAMVAVAALLLTACSGAVVDPNTGLKKYNWDFTITVSETSSWHKGAEAFKAELERASKGRMTVNLFANEQLSGGDAAAGVEQLMDGQKAFSYNSTIIYSGIDQRFSAINAPFLFSNYDQVDEVLGGSALTAYRKLAKENGVELLGFGESGFRQVTNSKVAIDQPSKLKGLKLRVPGSSLFMDIHRTLGADPVTMNFAEVFTSLQNGTIDGQENPLDVIYSNGIAEVQDHLTVWNYVYDPLMLGMSKEIYDSLSPDDQKIVTAAAAAANKVQIEDNRAREVKQLAELKNKVTVTELSTEESEAFRAAVNPVYKRFATVWTKPVIDAVTPHENRKG
ncbi:DctP family TRAP transporter solute-binding subunit [Galactobacter valiniphilus]|uniref:DctP family TRAP transporter solute-binding subunit n=1 Tax=Galactobacter valiniphilus TaxID=2676122 RepID=UPI0037365A1C